ncbi:hypothetical protein HUU42_00545 [bacterium]|nr:hypothetical protein [bacterium]
MRFFQSGFLCGLLCLALSMQVMAQDEGSSDSQENNGFSFQGPSDGMGYSQFTAPVGYTRIGDQNFISLRLQPELAFGKFGAGLDIPLLFNTSDGKLRTDEYKGGVGPLRIIRYVRYGVKHKDPVYVRVGDISGSYLGYGLTMYNYTNAVSFEKRKVGVNYDLNYDLRFGIEGVYSDFNGFNIFGVRPYARPLKTSDIPIIKTTEVGVTYITDGDKNIEYGVTEIGADIGMTVLESKMVQIVPYIEYARIMKNSDLKNDLRNNAIVDEEGNTVNLPSDAKYGAGQGLAIGTNFRFNFVADVFNMGVKLERRFYSDNFVPQYFDAVYEINKDRKAIGLISAEGVQGTYGEIFANLINKVQILGGISIPDKLKKTDGAFIHLGLSAPDLIPQTVIYGSYDKGYLDDLGEAFKFNQNSIAHLVIAYKLYPYLLTGFDYKWTFVKTDNGFKAKRYITPFVGLQLQLPVGDQKK